MQAWRGPRQQSVLVRPGARWPKCKTWIRMSNQISRIAGHSAASRSHLKLSLPITWYRRKAAGLGASLWLQRQWLLTQWACRNCRAWGHTRVLWWNGRKGCCIALGSSLWLRLPKGRSSCPSLCRLLGGSHLSRKLGTIEAFQKIPSQPSRRKCIESSEPAWQCSLVHSMEKGLRCSNWSSVLGPGHQ